MIRRPGLVCWLVIAGILTGCVSAPPQPARPNTGTRVDVQTEPAPVPPPAPVEPRPAAPDRTEATPPPAPPPPAPPPAPSAPPPAAAPAPPPTPKAPARSVVLNFDNADIEVVIQAAAEIVGFNYVLAPGARGRKVTVQTSGKISSDEVFGVLLTILDV
ncbi:MAG TPA: hypothetical protein VF578_15265, partial [Methylomirabilota bacterium]